MVVSGRAHVSVGAGSIGINLRYMFVTVTGKLLRRYTDDSLCVEGWAFINFHLQFV